MSYYIDVLLNYGFFLNKKKSTADSPPFSSPACQAASYLYGNVYYLRGSTLWEPKKGTRHLGNRRAVVRGNGRDGRRRRGGSRSVRIVSAGQSIAAGSETSPGTLRRENLFATDS